MVTLPETNSLASEDQSLEDEISFCGGLFSGVMSVSGRVNILGAKWRTGVCEAGSRGYHAKNDGRCGVAVRMENVCLWYAPDDRCVESRRLTARFGLRCSEALCLNRERIEINSDEPHINVAGDTPGNMKSPDKVYFRPQDIKWMESLLKKVYKVQRRRKHKHGTCHFEECFKIPETGAWGISMAISVGMMIFFRILRNATRIYWQWIVAGTPLKIKILNPKQDDFLFQSGDFFRCPFWIRYQEPWREMFFSRWDFLVNFVSSLLSWSRALIEQSKKKTTLVLWGFWRW